MKTNICNKGMWWGWTETCDRCGHINFTANDQMSSEKPDINEADFCVDCYRYLMDNNISYNEALKKYKTTQNDSSIR